MLASAIYFKGKWKNAFDLQKTSVKCFYVDVNQCLNTYFMESVNVYNYAYITSLRAYAVELPYEVSTLIIIVWLISYI
jgi:serine protease inhibitor